MELLGKHHFVKLKKKQQGNAKLVKAIDKLITDIERATGVNDLLAIRVKDADSVHGDEFSFFDINIHRTLVQLERDAFDEDEREDEDDKSLDLATIEWVGSHDKYDRMFNNRDVITKWLKNNGLI
jgi:hypothetical protein